ncbi:MAG: PilT/PilU family type 4a pilus ATPase [Zetaproteobacteria bacterium]|nr:MAG: PilT/PilU family type 4a pilus ATPase [Zetaproteobacteria bacterium]
MNGALIDDLLLAAHKHKASDLILRAGDRVRMRIHGRVVTVSPDKVPPPSPQLVRAMIDHALKGGAHPSLDALHHYDFHYSLENIAHFRMHAFKSHGTWGLVARLLPQRIPSFEELRLPPVIQQIAHYRHGLVLVAGATGSGKSTTMAAMLNHLIQHRPVHAVTIEDPIEYHYATHHPGTVTQRELGHDVESYEQGLLDALREAPDVIIAGEARSREVLQLALLASETGHFVMATVHATTAIGALQRVMGAFALDEQDAIRERLAEALRAVIVQKLLPRKDGQGRIVALEIMIKNSVIKHFILDPNRWREIPRAMEEGRTLYGSQTFDQHLEELVREGLVEYEEALAHAVFPEDFAMRLGRD